MKPIRLSSRRWLWLLLLWPAAACSGAHAHQAVASASPTGSARVVSASSAEGAVVDYYSLLGRHDPAGAAQLLDPELARELLAAQGSELHNVVRLTHLRDLRATAASLAPDLPSGYDDITQVFLTYDVVYRQEIAAMNGANSRFVYVGRNRSGQWRILEIGTGP